MTEEQTIKNMEMELIEEECFVDLSEKMSLPPVAISFGEHESISKEGKQILPTPIGTYGNFSFIQAAPKTKKTYLISLISSVYLSNTGHNTFGGKMKAHRGKKCLIHFDTEQGKYHAQKVFNRVVDMNESTDVGCYYTYALRPISYKKRIEFIEYKLKTISETEEVGLIVIDGVADLVSDVNNIEESNLCVQKIMEWSSRFNCHIMTVIHTNYGSYKATGHLGSFLMKKTETSIQLEENTVNEGNITVKCDLSRGIPFDTFSFRLNKFGYPEVVGFDFDLLEGMDYKKKQYL